MNRNTLGPLFLFIFLLPLLLLSCNRQENQPVQGQEQTPHHYDGTIIAVGDSLTAGLGVAEENAWPALLEKMLRENGFNWQVINAGISGETSSGALARIQWVASRKPDIVILETGANDGFRGIPTSVIKTNISKAVQLLQEKNITVVLAGMQMVQNLGPEYTKAFAAIYPDVAGEEGCLLIPFILQNVAGIPALNQEDTIHPNKQGHAIIAETVYPFAVEAIHKVRRAAE